MFIDLTEDIKELRAISERRRLLGEKMDKIINENPHLFMPFFKLADEDPSLSYYKNSEESTAEADIVEANCDENCVW